MDRSYKKNEENDPIIDQRKYILFKSIHTKKDKFITNYDPSDRMIADSIIYVMVATMKQIKIDIQRKIGKGNIDDSIPIYVPIVLVINELASNMMINEHFKTIFFGIHNKSKRNFDETKLVSLAETLANKILNDFICKNDSYRDYDETHNGSNMFCALAGCSYETRYRVWLDKLKNLLLKSNEHWLINQFQYCKILMVSNSFEMNVEDIPEYLFDAIPYLTDINKKLNAQNEEHIKINQDNWNCKDEINNGTTKNRLSPSIKMINIPSFIGFFLGNESRINKIYKDAAKSKNLKHIIAWKELIERRENQSLMKITSSSFGLAYEAVSKLDKS